MDETSRPGQGVFRGVATGVFGLDSADRLLDALEDVLSDDVGQRDRVVAVEAGHAQAAARLLTRRDQSVQGDEAERISTDRVPDALDVEPAGDEFGLGREVDPVE